MDAALRVRTVFRDQIAGPGGIIRGGNQFPHDLARHEILRGTVVGNTQARVSIGVIKFRAHDDGIVGRGHHFRRAASEAVHRPSGRNAFLVGHFLHDAHGGILKGPGIFLTVHLRGRIVVKAGNRGAQGGESGNRHIIRIGVEKTGGVSAKIDGFAHGHAGFFIEGKTFNTQEGERTLIAADA